MYPSFFTEICCRLQCPESTYPPNISTLVSWKHVHNRWTMHNSAMSTESTRLNRLLPCRIFASALSYPPESKSTVPKISTCTIANPEITYVLINPLSAKPSFQLWYPGGQRLKVISFSWPGVKSPSKCFSNTEPRTIIASSDEKQCNASVQGTRSVHSSSLRLSDQHRKCHGWLLFFAVPALQPDRPAAVHRRRRKQRSVKR